MRAVINRCHSCLRYSLVKLHQKMGNLPEFWVNVAFPCQKSGINYAGPVLFCLTKSRGKGTMKAYIAVYICIATRAIHLELAEDYSFEAFITTFNRLTARRGHCTELYSDCGTNFVGADTCLQKLFKEYQSENSTVFHRLVSEGTQWNFNPPSAPHFGGLWEAAV